MPNPVSQPARTSAYAQHTSEVWLTLLTIDHPSIDPPIRVVREVPAGQTISSNGNTFVGMPFEISLPHDDVASPPRTRMSVDNISREIVQAVREASGDQPAITLEIVLASSPDVVESGPYEMTLKEARYNDLVVEGEIAAEDVLNEPFPGDSFTPNLFPGLF